ncbi:hypothetical protein IAT38_005672 [Cryptococcus sp. DSM 104549]
MPSRRVDTPEEEVNLISNTGQADPSRQSPHITSTYPNVAFEHLELFALPRKSKPAKIGGRPLNRTEGHLGEGSSRKDWEEKVAGEKSEVETGSEADIKGSTGASTGYDVVYILNSMCHYTPSRLAFLSTLRSMIGPTTIIAFTDILPPPSLPSWKAGVVSYLFSVALRNLQPAVTLEEYKASLEEEGWRDVVVDDWSEGVLYGLAMRLEGRGGVWRLLGGMIGGAAKEGWRFVGVRIRNGPVEMSSSPV